MYQCKSFVTCHRHPHRLYIITITIYIITITVQSLLWLIDSLFGWFVDLLIGWLSIVHILLIFYSTTYCHRFPCQI